MFYSAPIIILVFIGNNYEVFIDPLATIKNSSPIITFMTVLVTVVMIYGLYALWNEIVMIEVSKDSIAFTCWREPYVFKMEEIESYDSKNYKWIKIQSEEGGSYKFYLIGKWSFYRNKEKMEAFDRVIEILESKFSSSDSV